MADEKLLNRQRAYLTTLYDAGLLDDEAFATYCTACGSPISRASITQYRNGKTPMPLGAALLLDGYHASRNELIAASNIRLLGRAVRVVSDVEALPTGKTSQQEGIEAVDATVAALTSLSHQDPALTLERIAYARQQLAELEAAVRPALKAVAS